MYALCLMLAVEGPLCIEPFIKEGTEKNCIMPYKDSRIISLVFQKLSYFTLQQYYRPNQLSQIVFCLCSFVCFQYILCPTGV